LFQAIGLSDRVRMSLLPEGSDDDTFECDMEGVPTDRTNLVLRAVDTFREATVREVYVLASRDLRRHSSLRFEFKC
jgi:4-diphosphocytidyl-2-C-methyl-D-erythritol kinase